MFRGRRNENQTAFLSIVWTGVLFLLVSVSLTLTQVLFREYVHYIKTFKRVTTAPRPFILNLQGR